MSKYIYKYFRFDENLKRSLCNSYVWFSKPEVFNDPFEFEIQGPGNLRKNEVVEYFHLLIDVLGVRIDEILQGDTDAFFFAYEQDPEKFLDLFLEPFRTKLNSWGLSCFSGTFDNILMWSHYAAKHTGLVIKFDREKLDSSLKKSSDFSLMNSVNYQVDFPLINISKEREKTVSSIREIVFTKAIDWEYEDEIRIWSNKTGEHKFSKDSVAEVILGANFPEPSKAKLSSILEKHYPNNKIILSQMVLSKRMFTLEKKPI